jgi:hypothetical protein
MITFDDCMDCCELEEAEIEAIAEHEHVPEIVALELGQYLLGSKKGIRQIKKFIQDDIAEAKSNGHPEKASELRKLLDTFDVRHKAAC